MIGKYLKQKMHDPDPHRWVVLGSGFADYSKSLGGFSIGTWYFHFCIKIRIFGKGSNTAIAYAGRMGSSGTLEVFPFRAGYLHMTIAIPFRQAKKFLRFRTIDK